MFADTKRSLKNHDPARHEQFVEAMKASANITTQKRFYMSTYGFENSREVILGQTDKLIPNKENYDKHYMSNITERWKRKASSRFDTLTQEGRIRTDMEIWNADTMDKIDIIRWLETIYVAWRS